MEHLWSQQGVKVVMGKPSCCCHSDRFISLWDAHGLQLQTITQAFHSKCFLVPKDWTGNITEAFNPSSSLQKQLVMISMYRGGIYPSNISWGGSKFPVVWV